MRLADMRTRRYESLTVFTLGMCIKSEMSADGSTMTILMGRDYRVSIGRCVSGRVGSRPVLSAFVPAKYPNKPTWVRSNVQKQLFALPGRRLRSRQSRR